MDATLARKERSLLGELIQSFPPELPPIIKNLLRHAPESFDDLRHGLIARIVFDLRAAGRPIHHIGLLEYVSQKKLAERCGGNEYVNGLILEALPIGIVEHEAGDIWEAYQNRQSKSIFEEAKHALEVSPDKARAIIEGAAAALKSLSDSAATGLPEVHDEPLRPVCRAAIDRYEMMKANVGKLGVPTGIPHLDAISGGMKPGQTIVVAGTTGGGKSTFGLHMANAALTAGYGVALFSLEMDREEIFDLLLSSRCRIDRNKFNTGNFSEYDIKMMIERLPLVQKLPLYIEDSALADVERIRARVMQLKLARKIGLVIVDYIQFVNPQNSRDTREQQVAAISHSLRTLSREARLPVVVLSQLNDEGKLRESRVIAHNANVVMLIDVHGDEFTVRVVKGRGIPEGEYKLEFQRTFATLAPYQLSNPYND